MAQNTRRKIQQNTQPHDTQHILYLPVCTTFELFMPLYQIQRTARIGHKTSICLMGTCMYKFMLSDTPFVSYMEVLKLSDGYGMA